MSARKPRKGGGTKDAKTSEFQRAMEDVTPLRKDPPRPRAPRAPRRLPASEPRRWPPLEIHRTGELVEGRAPGLDRRRLKSLKRGEIEVNLRLDLHGLLEAKARNRLRTSIQGAVAQGQRCILVVHGRGLHSPDGPVLKNALLDWLQDPAILRHVLAFATAQPRDGGTGATYILLRRSRGSATRE